MRPGWPARPIIRHSSRSWGEIVRSTSPFGDHGGAPRVQSIIAHSLIYILALSMLFRVTAWFGWFVAVTLVFNAILLLCWVVSSVHRHRDHLCEWCMRDVPADAPTEAERRLPLLRLAHFNMTVAGTAVFAVVVVVPPLLTAVLDGSPTDRLLYIPGDVWITAVIYSEWVHHRLRPWCPFCKPWDDEGDEEPAPDPVDSDESVRVR